jgi:hypothetical protein
MASITSSNSKKGAVSTDTVYDAKVAAVKKAADLQKNQASYTQLLSANNSLFLSISKPDSSGKSLSDYVSKYTNMSTYVRTMVDTGKWGPVLNTNYTVASEAGTSGTLTPGTTITSSDITLLITYKSSQDAKATTYQKKIDAINAKIAANKVAMGNLNPKIVKDNGGKGAPPKTSDNNAQTSEFKVPPEFPTPDYVWNLPPHAWSLPMDPAEINPDFVTSPSADLHANRRGRIWYYNGYVGPTNVLKADTGTYDATLSASTTPPPGSVNKYGFQFIWNPETYNQSTSVNMNVTPSNTDPTIALTGFAAANSQMSFTLRLDRTNDFASAKGVTDYILDKNANGQNSDIVQSGNALVALASSVTGKKLKTGTVSTTDIVTTGLAKYYKVGQPGKNSTAPSDKSIDEKISNLLKYGTEADLEYLYRVVNGDGWKGIGGRETSNIGYLMPALIRVDLGNQKFVAVVSSVQVTHLAFTRDMVPIRSDVSISLDLRANIQPVTNTAPSKNK